MLSNDLVLQYLLSHVILHRRAHQLTAGLISARQCRLPPVKAAALRSRFQLILQNIWKLHMNYNSHCYAATVRDIRKIGEQSGRNTGRLGSTGRRHSWHSGAHLPLLTSPGLDTVSDDYGPGGAAGGWTSPPPPPGPARHA
jgi:hypothetical protein